MKTEQEPVQVIDLPSWLAYLYKPILPYLNAIKITRQGSPEHNPRDILLPEGYVAEIVATGFHSPVHCCFDGQGFCYVSESGHKIDSRPRILKVDLATGQYEPVFVLPEDEWHKTGALTGACWHGGALYIAPERGGLRMPLGTGALWRIRRVAGPRGERPPEPTTVPLYALQLAMIAGAAGVAGWGLRRLLRRWRPWR